MWGKKHRQSLRFSGRILFFLMLTLVDFHVSSVEHKWRESHFLSYMERRGQLIELALLVVWSRILLQDGALFLHCKCGARASRRGRGAKS